MGLVVLVEHVPLPAPRASLALAAATSAPGAMSAHVHIGRSGRARAPQGDVLLDRGTQRCPCVIDVSFAELGEYLEDEGFGAEVYIEPLEPLPLRLDVVLRRRRDAGWSSEPLLPDCRPGSVRAAKLPELLGHPLRLSIRCTCPSSPNAMFWLRANEPRVRRPARAPGVMEAPRGR